MEIHPKLKIARTIALCSRARKAIDAMFEEVYDATANLEALGTFGFTDVLDRATEEMRAELAIIEAAAKAQRPLPTPAPAASTPSASV